MRHIIIIITIIIKALYNQWQFIRILHKNNMNNYTMLIKMVEFQRKCKITVKNNVLNCININALFSVLIVFLVDYTMHYTII